jgi:hypothetical protein
VDKKNILWCYLSQAASLQHAKVAAAHLDRLLNTEKSEDGRGDVCE